MKIGKVSQTVLKRSIQKQMCYRRQESVIEPSVEEMCAGIRIDSPGQVLLAGASIYGNEKDLGVFALARAANDLATRGAEMMGAEVQIWLPPYAFESRLKAMVGQMEEAGSKHRIQLLSVKAEVSPAVHTALLSMTGIGILKTAKVLQIKRACPDQDIVMVKWAGLDGTLRILREKEAELKKRFVPAFLKQAEELRAELFSGREIQLAIQKGAVSLQQISEGGVLAALWELAESAEIGIQVEMRLMPIRQETVEICEHYRLNPYQLTGVGSFLAVTDDGKALVDAYEQEGICAVVIGRTTKGTEKVLSGGEEKRCLDRPVPDELTKLLTEEAAMNLTDR